MVREERKSSRAPLDKALLSKKKSGCNIKGDLNYPGDVIQVLGCVGRIHRHWGECLMLPK